MFRCFVLALFILISADASATNLDSLFIKSVGGKTAFDSLQRISSFRAEGTINLNGQAGRFVEIFSAPDRLYLEVAIGSVVLIQAYDGHQAWQQDHNGRVSELTGYEKDALLSNIYFESFSYLLKDRMKGTCEDLGELEYDGMKYHQVAFYPLNNDTVRILFDPDDAMRRYSFSKLDNLRSISQMGDYRFVGGVAVPHFVHTSFEDIPLFTSLETDSITLNIEIDQSVFSMPARAVADYSFADSSASVRIGFEYRLGHIWLPATINGTKKVWFILDSGASANIFHTATIADLNLPVEGSLPVVGMAGYEEVQLVRSDSISIGALTLYAQVAGSMDLSAFVRSVPHKQELGGMLGYDFLSRFPVLIDYRDSSLTVFDPQAFELPPGGIAVDFNLTMLVPSVTGELNGIKGEFIVDLGNAFGLILHRNFVDKHHLEEVLDDVKTNPVGMGGVGGAIGSKTAFAATFRFGEISLQSLRVMLPEEGLGLAGSEELAGNIGNMILENFQVLFDYEGRRLVFYENVDIAK
ncbi:MAG: retroviral-like aspartic protease family protein [candidate division Zixibacteria bacterium]|nr:retroviral-like aspartic protease family protein [candidate division Zixibacteria bacterium]